MACRTRLRLERYFFVRIHARPFVLMLRRMAATGSRPREVGQERAQPLKPEREVIGAGRPASGAGLDQVEKSMARFVQARSRAEVAGWEEDWVYGFKREEWVCGVLCMSLLCGSSGTFA